jgi:hypothetical protein
MDRINENPIMNNLVVPSNPLNRVQTLGSLDFMTNTPKPGKLR